MQYLKIWLTENFFISIWRDTFDIFNISVDFWTLFCYNNRSDRCKEYRKPTDYLDNNTDEDSDIDFSANVTGASDGMTLTR